MRKVPIPVLVVSVIAALVLGAGCISPQDFQGGPEVTSGTMSPTPTMTASPEGQAVVSMIETSIPPDMLQNRYIKTHYGYIQPLSGKSRPYSVVEVKEVKDEKGVQFITGKIRNEANSRFDFISVTFNLYNANGYLLGNTYASAEYLGAGRIWKFSTEKFSYSEYQYFEIAEIFII